MIVALSRAAEGVNPSRPCRVPSTCHLPSHICPVQRTPRTQSHGCVHCMARCYVPLEFHACIRTYACMTRTTRQNFAICACSGVLQFVAEKRYYYPSLKYCLTSSAAPATSGADIDVPCLADTASRSCCKFVEHCERSPWLAQPSEVAERIARPGAITSGLVLRSWDNNQHRERLTSTAKITWRATLPVSRDIIGIPM